MGTRYGRHAADGTTEYHDTKESLIDAANQESREAMARFFGWFGLLIGGILTYEAFSKWGGIDLPKWIRFSGVILGAGIGAVTLAKLANLIVTLVAIAFVAGIVFVIGALIWRVV